VIGLNEIIDCRLKNTAIDSVRIGFGKPTSKFYDPISRGFYGGVFAELWVTPADDLKTMDLRGLYGLKSIWVSMPENKKAAEHMLQRLLGLSIEMIHFFDGERRACYKHGRPHIEMIGDEFTILNGERVYAAA
jgi:hypothetical protein